MGSIADRVRACMPNVPRNTLCSRGATVPAMVYACPACACGIDCTSADVREVEAQATDRFDCSSGRMDARAHRRAHLMHRMQRRGGHPRCALIFTIEISTDRLSVTRTSDLQTLAVLYTQIVWPRKRLHLGHDRLGCHHPFVGGLCSCQTQSNELGCQGLCSVRLWYHWPQSLQRSW